MSHNLLHLHELGTYESVGPESEKLIANELKKDLDPVTLEWIERSLAVVRQEVERRRSNQGDR